MTRKNCGRGAEFEGGGGGERVEREREEEEEEEGGRSRSAMDLWISMRSMEKRQVSYVLT